MHYVHMAQVKFLRLVDGLDSNHWIMIMAVACALGFIMLRGFGSNSRL